MPLKVSVTIVGDKETLKMLQDFGNSLGNWRSAFYLAGVYLVDIYTNKVFDTDGGFLGERWQDLNPVYELKKAKQYSGKGILEASGDLRQGFEKRVGDDELVIENWVPWGIFHQDGTKRLPQRKLVELNDTIRGKIIDIFANELKNKIVAAIKK